MGAFLSVFMATMYLACDYPGQMLNGAGNTAGDI